MSGRFEPAWDDFRFVKAIAEAGSLPAAAALLKVNHSTIFRRLNQIEEAVGHRLFERARTGYTPTPAGEKMLEAAGAMEGRVAAFARQVAGAEIAPTGEVRLTTSDTLLVHLLLPIMGEMREALPGIRLDLVVGNASLNLSKRDADVAVRATDDPPEALVGRRIASVAWALYGRRADFAAGAPVDLAAHDFVGMGENLANLAAVRFLKSEVAPERVVCRINTVLGLAEAVEAGIGIAHLPTFIGDRRPLLRRLAPPDGALAAGLWLLTHPDLRQVPRVRAVLDFLHAGLQGCRPLIEGERPAA